MAVWNIWFYSFALPLFKKKNYPSVFLAIFLVFSMKIKIKIPASSANLGSGFDCLSVALNLYNLYEFETHTKEMKQNFFEIAQFSLKEDLLTKAYLKTCSRYGLEANSISFKLSSTNPICHRFGFFRDCGFSRGSFSKNCSQKKNR